MPKIVENNKNVQLVGSWKSIIGEGDQYVHLYRYKNYLEFSLEFEKLRDNQYNKEWHKQTGQLVNKRSNHLCLSFTFWGEPQLRDTTHIYEMRSYALKPGTLIEWGNNWYVIRHLYI